MLETAHPLSLSETREKFWKRLRVRGYPFSFLLLLFREIRYSDRRRWLPPKSKHGIGGNKTIVFKTTFNCSHVRIKNAISHILPDLDCTVCYKSTVTSAIRSLLLFMASLFIGFLVEKYVTCQSPKSESGWHRFRFSPA